MNESIASNTDLSDVAESVGTRLMRALFDEVTNIRMPWAVTPQQQQQDLLDRLRMQVDEAVRVAVGRIAMQGFQHISASIESLTIKDEAKAVLLLSRGSEELHTLADRVGSRAIIVFADHTEYTDGMNAIKSQADQPSLPLGDGDTESAE
jgi:hypothetical protein